MTASTQTVNDLVAQSLREIGVIRETQLPSPEQLTQSITKLNQMLDDWEVDGIELGWYPVSAGIDVIPIQQKDELGVMFNLSIVLAGKYGAPLQQSTIAEATRTKSRLEKATVSLVEMDLSDLPGVGRNRYNIQTG